MIEYVNVKVIFIVGIALIFLATKLLCFSSSKETDLTEIMTKIFDRHVAIYNAELPKQYLRGVDIDASIHDAMYGGLGYPGYVAAIRVMKEFHDLITTSDAAAISNSIERFQLFERK